MQNLKKLTLSSRREISRFLSKINAPEPSDFNFLSLYTYNTQNDTIFSITPASLFVVARDYISSQSVLTAYSKSPDQKFIDELMFVSRRLRLKPMCHLVPEYTISKIKLKNLRNIKIREDEDNYDYVLSVEDLASLKGNKFSNKRNMINRFRKDYSDYETKQLDIESRKTREEMKKIFKGWAMGKNKSAADIAHEYMPISRLFRSRKYFKTINIGLFAEDRLVGFAVAERINPEYSIFHFVKTLPGFRGASDFLYHELGKNLRDSKCKYLNIEQDLGLRGLKHAKSQWNPVMFIKKYSIELT